MGLSRQEYWSGLPCPLPGDFPILGIEPASLNVSCIAGRLGIPHNSVDKASYSVGDLGSIPGSGSSPGARNGNPLPYPCLGNPLDRGVWRATVHGIASQIRYLPSFLSLPLTSPGKYSSVALNVPYSKPCCLVVVSLLPVLGRIQCPACEDTWWVVDTRLSLDEKGWHRGVRAKRNAPGVWCTVQGGFLEEVAPLGMSSPHNMGNVPRIGPQDDMCKKRNLLSGWVTCQH